MMMMMMMDLLAKPKCGPCLEHHAHHGGQRVAEKN
jgi:hypothetical protein